MAIAPLACFCPLFRRPIASRVLDYQFFGQILDNDDVVLVSPTRTPLTDAFETVLLSRDGVERWAVSNPGISPSDFSTNVVVDDKNVYLSRRGAFVVNGDVTARALRVYALSINDGRSVWTQDLKGTQNSDSYIYPPSDPDQILISMTSDLGYSSTSSRA